MEGRGETVARVVVIGYGNPHRQDDRAGHVVAEAVREWARQAGRADVRVLTACQLDVDMVEEISSAAEVYFCDTHVVTFSEDVAITPVDVAEEGGFTTHLITPGGLLGLCGKLYQRQPRGVIVSVPGERFDMGDEMSARTAAKVAEAAAWVIGALGGDRPEGSFAIDKKC
ncbi:MAG: hydrogenase maturation protease [bacterium]|nr:hydrogenase maturation protease [bacterium]